MSRVLFAVLTILTWTASARADDAYVGSGRCASCHEVEAERWRESHHDLAMAKASEATVLGDFDDAEFIAYGVKTRFFRAPDGSYQVTTDGPDGTLRDYAVTHTFGWHPLQQYLVPFPGGRLQALGIAWDTRPASQGGQRWFHLYPDRPVEAGDPLHWTSPDQTWNHQCAECHSTNLVKGYDLASDRYETTWSEIDVACEACHGPGNAHVAWAEVPADERAVDATRGLVVDLATGSRWALDPTMAAPVRTEGRDSHAQVETCARCHSRRGQISGDYTHGKPLGDTHRLALLDDRLYFPDGQIRDEVYVHGSFLQSRMHQAGVACTDCHDPHSLELHAPGNLLCGRCHSPERYDTTEHHHHRPGSAGAACTACHMPERTYMVVDERADHSLRVPRPDLAARLGTPDACTACHLEHDPRWAAEVVAGWGSGASPPAHFASTFDAAARGTPGSNDALAAIAGDAARPGIVRASAIARLRPPLAPAIDAGRGAWIADPDPLVREAAVRSLEQADLPTRIALGLEALDDPVRSVRFAATRALAPALREGLPEAVGKRIEAGLAEYLAAARVNADRAEMHLDTGVIATQIGRLRAAEAAYRTAIGLDRTFTPAYANLADLYRALGREAEAERTLRAGIEVDGEDAALRHALGLALLRGDRLDEALEPLATAARLAPQNARFALVLGVALREAGRPIDALDVLERGLARSPSDRDLLQALAAAYAATGDTARADTYLKRLEGSR